jgi:hypothetical protein
MKQSDWISVKDRIPDGREVFDWEQGGRCGFVLGFSMDNSATPAVVCFQLGTREGEIEWIPDEDWFEVTHWQPLPDNPQKE